MQSFFFFFLSFFFKWLSLTAIVMTWSPFVGIFSVWAHFRTFVFIFYGGKGRFLFPILLLFCAVKEEMFFSLIVFPHLNSWVDIVNPMPPFQKNPFEPHFSGGRWLWVRHLTGLLSALGGLVSVPIRPKHVGPVWACGPEGLHSHQLGWKAWDGGVSLADCC